MDELDLDHLPEDPAALQQLVIDQYNELRFLKEQIHLLLQRRFAARSEKYPGQHELFDEAETDADADADAECEEAMEEGVDQEESVEIALHVRRTPGRKPLPEHLPRVEVIHDLPEAEKFCSEDGHPLHRIGEEVSEQLEVIPDKVQVIRHIRVKYGCRRCETGVTTAPMPPQLIPKSMAAPGLLAYVAVSKYADALPLYRQSEMFRRIGVELSRTTLANWMVRVGEALSPILESMRGQLLSSRVVHMDETPVQVLKEPDRSPQSPSYMWVAMSGNFDEPVVLYHYDPSRGRQVPIQMLEGYRGHLVTDGYAGYRAVNDQAGVTGVGCWAHARRKFDEARKVQGKSPGVSRAQYAMNEIAKLYGIERMLEGKPPAERYRVRQARAGPILGHLRDWLDKSLVQVPPKTRLGMALGYLDSEWDRLNRYLGNGELPIDNNRCENAIRPFVVGRKNWLFSDTQEGARASAAIYSVIETAKANGLEPYRYIKELLTELPKAHDDLTALLPFGREPDIIRE